jgi:hypothetical protein
MKESKFKKNYSVNAIKDSVMVLAYRIYGKNKRFLKF